MSDEDEIPHLDKKEMKTIIDRARKPLSRIPREKAERRAMTELALITYKSQENLNKLTKILIILTAALILFTLILVYFTALLVHRPI